MFLLHTFVYRFITQLSFVVQRYHEDFKVRASLTHCFLRLVKVLAPFCSDSSHMCNLMISR